MMSLKLDHRLSSCRDLCRLLRTRIDWGSVNCRNSRYLSEVNLSKESLFEKNVIYNEIIDSENNEHCLLMTNLKEMDFIFSYVLVIL